MYEYRCKISRVVDGDTVDVDIDLGFGQSKAQIAEGHLKNRDILSVSGFKVFSSFAEKSKDFFEG